MSVVSMYPCDYPGCTFSSAQPGNLTVHKRLHSGDKPYQCDACGKTFSRKDHLVAHKRSHSGERPYTCDVCPAAFTTKSNLTKHQLTHTDERPHTCEECGKAFRESGHLKNHMRSHTGERPYQCSDCEQSFIMSHHLRNHQLTHSDETPHKCDVCSAAFSRLDTLETHKHIHDNSVPRPHARDICGKRFTRTDHLVSHKRTHTKEKPFSCDYPMCGYKASQQSHVTAHKQAVHTTEGIRRHKRKEEGLAKALTRGGITFVREHRVTFECLDGTWASCDFVTVQNGRVLIVECDEFQHRYSNYTVSCDIKRMMDIVAAWRLDGCTLPITIIRWNPDHFTVDEVQTRLPRVDRYHSLITYINNCSDEAMYKLCTCTTMLLMVNLLCGMILTLTLPC